MSAKDKNEIIIKISKKDRIYLSIILCIVCICACIAILVPRYYKTKYNNVAGNYTNNNSSQTTPNYNNSNNSNTNYSNSTSVELLNKLINVGEPFSSIASKYVSNGDLNTTLLDVNDNDITTLNTSAETILTLIKNKETTTTLTVNVIFNDEVLFNKINEFLNTLENLEKF